MAISLAAVSLPLGSKGYAQSVTDPLNGPQDAPSDDLLDVSLEDLLTLESTSVAKKRQRVVDSASAVYVITQEDIQRSAASTIPELLRGVPGVEVGRQTNGGYAVTIRGFNSRLANALLVMVDGRSQFVSTLSGVFWDQLMVPIGDIERIEIVRGPGASLWGANSSNGVINIITKHSADTGGVSFDARAGSRFQQGSLSYGGRMSDALNYRVYGTVRHDNGLVDVNGDDVGRRWQGGAAGTRLDWQPDSQNAATVQLDYARGSYDNPLLQVNADLTNPGYSTIRSRDEFESFSVLGRWTQRTSENFDWSLQAQYNDINRCELGNACFDWQLADLDLGFHWRANDVHDVNFGLGARVLLDELEGPYNVRFTDSADTDYWLSGYIQDDISLIPDTLRLTLGTKLEYNNFTGVEVQPTARIFYKPVPEVSLWSSVTRAVRTPSRMERAAQFNFTVELPNSATNPFPLPVYPVLLGDADRGSEHLLAYEAGARFDLGGSWSLDLAGYYNDYRKITVTVPGEAFPLFQDPVPYPLGLGLALDVKGIGRAKTWGGEASLSGRIMPWWKVRLNYSHFDFHVPTDPQSGSPYLMIFPLEGSPRHQVSLSNSVDIGSFFSVDSQLRHVSRLAQGPVPAYTALDLKATYRLPNGAELSLIGNDLLQARHVEFTQPFYPAPMMYVARTISAQLRFRF
ncbi:TonB-dependent receptor plug domain-containing protein [Novosphingobium decolorationis]|uniref:TonB-dependent receptor n=1 Tax=Novosphingobium decolorationis TaxID=2698673 RepID=A0ABX8E9P1_9SPHN|nr:TonB-dependent receptor [Novosphingobium decolorationis]QVM85739.1 TonB-dependent receptor [Novosphingobium decolorationis]